MVLEVRPYADALSRFFPRNPIKQNLPCKITPAFEGCSEPHARPPGGHMRGAEATEKHWDTDDHGLTRIIESTQAGRAFDPCASAFIRVPVFLCVPLRLGGEGCWSRLCRAGGARFCGQRMNCSPGRRGD